MARAPSPAMLVIACGVEQSTPLSFFRDIANELNCHPERSLILRLRRIQRGTSRASPLPRALSWGSSRSLALSPARRGISRAAPHTLLLAPDLISLAPTKSRVWLASLFAAHYHAVILTKWSRARATPEEGSMHFPPQLGRHPDRSAAQRRHLLSIKQPLVRGLDQFVYSPSDRCLLRIRGVYSVSGYCCVIS